MKRSSTFHFDIWLTLTLLHWICDFGRGITALYVSDAFPTSLPSIGDYGHMVYNVVTGFCMLHILRRCINPVPSYVQVSEICDYARALNNYCHLSKTKIVLKCQKQVDRRLHYVLLCVLLKLLK